jgi:DNA (cytosine-5)-methyltransferase 1
MLVAHSLRADGFDASEDGTGRGTPLVPVLADPISAHEQSTYTHEGKGNFRLRNVIPFDTTQVTHPDNRSRCLPGDPIGTLAKSGHAPAVAFTVSAQANGFAWESPVAPTIGAHPQSDTSQRQTGVRTPSGVRRLTPRECERLQGFPDDWTAIPGMADGPRYKCLGNAVTVNVAEWIARRIGRSA